MRSTVTKRFFMLFQKEQRKSFINYWTAFFSKSPTFSFPEKRINDSLRASMVNLILATRSEGVDSRRQGSGLPYDDLFLNGYFDMRVAYGVFNLPEFTTPNVDWLINKQTPNGNFIDVHNRGYKAGIILKNEKT